MSNKDIDVALDYHRATSHARQRPVDESRLLDPANRPLPYKIYSSLAPIPLPTDSAPPSDHFFEALTHSTVPVSGEQVPDKMALAQLCFFSNGVTKVLKRDGKDVPVRAAASTGSLYHIEMYLVCGDLPDLSAGVYHYGAHDHALRQLRSGDYRRSLTESSASEPSIVSAPVIVIYTSTFWRNAYRYGSRAYRHTFWDGGTVLANSLTISSALNLPASLVLGFVDERVNALLDIDGEHEAAISLLSFGHTLHAPVEAPAITPLDFPTVQLSSYEVAYPRITELHHASSLATPQEVLEWRNQSELVLPNPILSTQPLIALQPATLSDLPTDSVEAIIRRRGSTRRFTHQAISFEQLSTLLTYSLQPLAADCFPQKSGPLCSLYLIANAVENLPNGTYVLHADQHALELLQAGTYRHAASILALFQDLGGDAAVNVYFLVDLAAMLARFGNRGYRVAQFEAAIIAGKMYLAAYALSLGATGLTFFDDETITFFSPHSENQQVMFLMAFGHSFKRAQISH